MKSFNHNIFLGKGFLPRLAIITLSLILLGITSTAQVRVPFEPRSSEFTPNKTTYSIKGDFTMIGNTNLTLRRYADNKNNSQNDMIYVDKDTDGGTQNSSSANLQFSTENGAFPECSNVIYAGLYWTGRMDYGYSLNSTERLAMRTVKFKAPGGSYQTLQANDDEIRYPGDNDMYAGYIEVTDIVKNAGEGEYWLADIALSEGNGGSTGYYGGWGLVVVYENSKMKWRDITVFDGYAYVQGSTANHTLEVSGFNTVQAGPNGEMVPVDIKMGFMAGEGDVGISGDYFEIQKQVDNSYMRLSHTGNTTENFFNSSIETGGNLRNPNLPNNTGLDISMFNVVNTDNEVIANSQTSTRFRYGSTQDTYVIFSIVFAVDAYIPETEAIVTNTAINGVPNPVSLFTDPGHILDIEVELKNKGTEATDNTLIVIPIPYTASFVENSISSAMYPPLTSSNAAPVFDPNLGATGSIVWDIGNFPLPSDPDDLLASISFQLKATEDCSILINPNCTPRIAITGTTSGVGATTGTPFEHGFIQGHETSGNCVGEPIPSPLYIDFDDDAVGKHCTGDPDDYNRKFYYCNRDGLPVQVAEVEAHFPPGSRFYNEYPIDDQSTEFTADNPFPAKTGTVTYYAIPPGITNCFFVFDIIIDDVRSTPTVNDVDYCLNDAAVALNATPSNSSYNLYYYTDNNPSTTAQTSIIPSTANAGQTTYYVAEGLSNACISPNRVPIIVSVIAPPSCEITGSSSVCPSSTNNIYSAPAGMDSYSWSITSGTATINAASDAQTVEVIAGSCNEDFTLELTVTNSNECSSTCSLDVEVEDNIAPTFDATPGNLTASCTPPAPYADYAAFVAAGGLVSDNCALNTASFTHVGDVSDNNTCEPTIQRTYRIFDACGLSVDYVQEISIDIPMFTPAADGGSTVNCLVDAQIEPTPPTVYDYCGNLITPVLKTTPADIACEGDMVWVFTYTDCAGNTDDWNYTYTIDIPMFTPAADGGSTVNCLIDAQIEPTPPTVYDYCGNLITPVLKTTPADIACEGDMVWVFTYTDCAGNSDDWNYTYTIDIPMFTPAADGGSTVNCLVDAQIEPTPPTVYDYCGNLITPVLKTTPADIACEGDMVWVFTYTDCAGNTDDWNYTYTIDIPMFTPAADGGSTVNCLVDAQIEPTPPTVYDYCGNLITPVLKTTPADIACEGDMVWVFTYTDCAGNSDDWNYTYTIDIPMFTPAADGGSTVNCLVDAQIEPTPPTVYDYCGNLITPVLKTTPADIACEGDMVWVFTYTDCAGNTDDWNYTYTIDIPMFTPAADGGSTVNCLVDAQIEPTPPTVYDYCGNLITPVLKTTPADIACEGDMVWVFTYTDCAGNSDDWNYTYTIDIPMFTPAADGGSTVNCLVDAQIEPTPPTVYDYCGNLITPVLKTTPADIACEGDMVWVFTYTDCAGNSDDWNYTYTIDIPMFTPAADGGSTVNCLVDAQIEPTPPTVYDYCGNLITPVLKTTPADIACEGDMVWVFTYTDCAGNSDDWNYTYTIDIPMFTPAADGGSTVNCLVDAQVEPTPPTVYDYCGNLITPVLKTTPADIACEGDMVWVFTYTDCAGNSDDWNYTYTIDIPMFTPAADGGSTVNCLVDAQVEPTPPTVYDYCGNLITPVLKTTPADIACEGDMVWVFTYTDCAGNSDDWNYTYTIVRADFTMPENESETVNDLSEIYEPNNPTVYDYCGKLITDVTGPVISESPDCEGAVTYTWTYTDCSGKFSHDWIYTFTIDRIDFTVPEDDGEIISCIAELYTPQNPSVNDAYGNPITNVTGPVVSENPACEGDVTYVWTYTDCSGKFSHDWTYTFTIEREDFIMPQNTSETVACVADFEGVTPPEVTDACGNLLTPVAAEAPVAPACEGDMVYTWTYTDCEGNSHDWSHTVTIEREDFIMPDNTSETVACVADFEGVTPPEVTDACGNLITPVAAEAPVAPACEGDMVYTWTYTDCEGNSHDWSHTVTIEREDFIMPENTSETVACVADFEGVTPPEVTDACGNLITPVAAEAPVAPACEGDMVYTWTYTDCEGNSHDWSHTVTIEREDFIMPQNTSETVACVADFEGVTPPVVTDACGNLITPVAAEAPVAPACEGDMVYTWTYTDCEGNSHDWSHTVTIEREDFIMPENTSETVACVADFEGVTPPVVTDACGNLITPVAAEAPVAPACEGDMVYTWTYTDCKGNSHDWSHTVTIEREDFIMPENTSETVACVADFEGVTPPVVTDACGNLLTPVAAEAPVAPACEGDMVYTWTYTDCKGNAHDWSHTVTIEREDFIMPENTSETVACAADFEGVTPPEVTDACGNLLTPVAAEAPVAPACEGNMVYTWTYTDCKGNSHDWSHTVTIEREDFIMPENTSETVACVADFEGVTPPEVTDACGNLLTPIAAEAPVAPACEGDMVYTWTYTDCEGNSHDWSHTVNIKDEIAPTFNETLPLAEITAECDDVAEAVVLTAADNCDADVPVEFTETRTDGNCENSYTLTRVWTATDDCGNETSFTQTVTVSDNTAPTFNETLPLAEITAECDDVAEADVLTAADNCDTDVPVEFTETRTDGNCANSYTLTRVWTATDDCGNETSFTQTVTVSDNTAPAFNETLPLAEITAECDNVAEAVVLTAADNCDSDVPVEFTETRTDGNCANSYTLTRTWTATDDCGNETSFTQTVTVSDNTAPAFNETLPTAEITAECDDVAEAVVLTATDNCDTDVPVEFTETRTDGNCTNSYTLTRTWTATDDCGNETSFTQTVTVSDNTAPAFNETLPIAEITAECDDVAEAVVLTAADNCDSDVPVEFTETRTDGNCENSYTLTRTWTATDDCGNETSFTQTVTVTDNTAPTFNETLPTAEITAECDDVAEAVVLTATDNCDSDVPVEFTETRTDGNCANSYTLTRTWTATDDCGNETSFTQTVTVSDNTAPAFNETLPTAEITAECDDVAEAVVLTAADNCDSDVPVEFTETRTDGNCANSYTLTRTWTATDDCGNETSFTQIVTVSDNTAPAFNETLPIAEITAECDDVAEAVVLTATDNCDSDVPVEFTETRTDGNCANSYTLTRTWTATDDCGNETSFTQIVTVSDNTAPAFNETLPLAEITAECDDVAEAVVLTAADNCDSDVPVEFTETRTDGNCANSYTLTRTWTATDDCGNETSFIQTVIVSDNTAPTFNETLPLAEITAECDDVAEAVVLTAADNCDSDVPVEFTEARTDGNCENSYTLTRVWTATDDCGNETSFTQTVTVSDNTAPTFNETLPLAEITAECDDVAEAVVLTAADNCDSDVPVVFEETRTDGNCENSYTLTRTWTATDDCGNETSFTQTVTVSDNTAPTFNETLPIAEITAECDDVTEAVVLTAADNCDSDVPVVFEETRTDGNSENSYTLTRTWTATDDCGNETSFTQTVTVSDNTAPTFNETLPTAEVTAECDDVAEAVVLTAADNCDSDVPVEFTETRTDGNCANSYTLTRVWTATDDCGNETSFTQTVTVSDNTAPTFNETLPTAEITAECDDVAEAVVLTATDNCDSDVPVEFTETRTDGNCENSYTLTRTWTATDDCGNETSFTQIVTVSDNTAPEVTCNDITVQLDANGVATITVDDINGGATDNCGTIATMFISQETFNCDNVGENQVTLTAIDGCGNEATCTATVTVEEGDADCGFDPFKANDDILTLIYCPGETVSGDLDLFANDEGFTRENVSFTILTDLPNGVSATDGNLLYVNEQPTEAVITFTYSVCHTVNTENCDTAEVTIQVLVDTDCDGVPDLDDLDDDDDGILDIIEEENALDQTSLDSDGDGIVDRLDIDSDNDGIVDNIEWQSTIAEDGEYDYIFPLGTDSNNDGWDDAYDPSSNGITYEPWDMDLDGTPDYLDTNTDNEGEDDIVEGWDEFPNDSIADVSYIGSDADGDGLDDAYDTYNTTTEEWVPGQNAIGSDAYLQDTDDDGVRDWRDAVDDRPVPERFACGEPVIPNAFSPNQDGYNDYFKMMIYCTGDQGGSEERVLGDDYTDARIEIFNRWGNLVYEQERYGNEDYWGDVDAWWDGRSMHDMQVGDDQLPTATYYYILYFNDGSKEPITGFIFLNN
ncbi:gliding motility-associated C-terminal domain-containing protein [Draconibacterium orientale]|uniref:HYR-like domain-containing protein n=1 Tax=Draconibacterium orientale TaxID=1168034 RepID=UPI002ABDCB6E|nr:gliding motility-associated C-terminal domain-containing protein [Draconibacterium orientale]